MKFIFPVLLLFAANGASPRVTQDGHKAHKHSAGKEHSPLGRQDKSAQSLSVCRHTNTAFRCVKFLENYDGDTVKMYIHGVHPLLGKKIHVRLQGVDTAEINAPSVCAAAMAKKARDFVSSVLRKARRIDLENAKRGKYFRIVADVKVDGQSLADMLLKRNLAVPYGKKQKKTNWCRNTRPSQAAM